MRRISRPLQPKPGDDFSAQIHECHWKNKQKTMAPPYAFPINHAALFFFQGNAEFFRKEIQKHLSDVVAGPVILWSGIPQPYDDKRQKPPSAAPSGHSSPSQCD